MNLLTLKHAAKESAPPIFMGLGMSFGMMATVDGIKSTFKLHDDGYTSGYFSKNNPDPLKKKIKTAGKYYLKTAIFTGLAGMCFIGAEAGYSTKIAGVTAAASYFEKQLKEERAKARVLFGDEAEKSIRREVAKDHISKNPPPPKRSEEGYRIYDPVTEQYFEATQKELDHCEREMNRILNKECPVHYRYFLKHFKGVNYDLPICKEIGWFLDDTYADYHYWNESFFAHPYFEIQLDPQDTQYGEIYILRFSVEPMLAIYDIDEAKDSQDEHALY